jgi:hypothetical protein
VHVASRPECGKQRLYGQGSGRPGKSKGKRLGVGALHRLGARMPLRVPVFMVVRSWECNSSKVPTPGSCGVGTFAWRSLLATNRSVWNDGW